MAPLRADRGLRPAAGRSPPHPLPVADPSTAASFPSGHTLAAWCAATLLAEDDPWAPAYYAMAGAISFSRLHVRLHHATDVVAGSILGVALGRLGRHLLPAGGPVMRRLECAGARPGVELAVNGLAASA